MNYSSALKILFETKYTEKQYFINLCIQKSFHFSYYMSNIIWKQMQLHEVWPLFENNKRRIGVGRVSGCTSFFFTPNDIWSDSSINFSSHSINSVTVFSSRRVLKKALTITTRVNYLNWSTQKNSMPNVLVYCCCHLKTGTRIVPPEQIKIEAHCSLATP